MNELNIHIRLKEARKFLDLNQLQIANDLNIQQKTVSEIENGKLLNIPNRYIYYFSKKGISLKWIYDGSGLMTKNDSSLIKKEEKQESAVKKLLDTKKIQRKSTETTKRREEEINSLQSEMSSDTSGIINSKDFTINTLLSYIKSQEDMITFLQKIVSKEMGL